MIGACAPDRCGPAGLRCFDAYGGGLSVEVLDILGEAFQLRRGWFVILFIVAFPRELVFCFVLKLAFSRHLALVDGDLLLLG